MLNNPTTHGRMHASSLQRGSLLKLTQIAGSSRLKRDTSRALSRVCLGAVLISVSSNVPYGLYGALLGMFTSSRQAYVSGKHEPGELRRSNGAMFSTCDGRQNGGNAATESSHAVVIRRVCKAGVSEE